MIRSFVTKISQQNVSFKTIICLNLPKAFLQANLIRSHWYHESTKIIVWLTLNLFERVDTTVFDGSKDNGKRYLVDYRLTLILAMHLVIL